MVLKVARTASSDLGGVGSMISRSPSLRISWRPRQEARTRQGSYCRISAVLEELHMSFRCHTHLFSLCHNIVPLPRVLQFVLGGLCQEVHSAGSVRGFLLLGLLQLDYLPTLIGKS